MYGGVLVLDDAGFLWDPAGELGAANPHALRLSDATFGLCNVLLGEPGMGKSVEIRRVFERTLADVSADDTCLYVDLAEYQSDERLDRRVFDGAAIQSWKASRGVLYLFLDSLDEGQVHIRVLSSYLRSAIGGLDAARLRLYIACRTAAWPVGLGSFLARHFRGTAAATDQTALRMFEILPLTQRDAALAVEAESGDPDGFLEAVRLAGVGMFASRPITLRPLLQRFLSDGELPREHPDLVRSNCLELCRERNRSRIEAGVIGNLDPEQRLQVARRIAALTVFCRRPTICLQQGSSDPASLSLEDLASGSEDVGGTMVPLTRENLLEVLRDTGLFSAREGNQVLGWSHRTYAEFLAADYCLARGAPVEQLLDLLLHPSAPERRAVPQLQETLGWLFVLRQELLAELIPSDPWSVLRASQTLRNSRVAPTDAQKVALVERVLQLSGENAFEPLDMWRNDLAWVFGHPGLADQLRPHITAEMGGRLSQENAIRLAQACELVELSPEIADVALSDSLPLLVRTSAARAVSRIGDGESRSRLLPLALGQAGDDPRDDLRGAGLRAVWPQHLSAVQFFESFEPPRQGYVGAHAGFLSELVESPGSLLDPESLPQALAWAVRWGVTDDRSVKRLAILVLEAGWEAAESNSETWEAFVSAARHLLFGTNAHSFREGLQDLAARVSQDVPRRRRLLQAVYQQDGWVGEGLYHSPRLPVQFLEPEDLGWIADQMRSAACDNPQFTLWLKLFKNLRWQVPDSEWLEEAYVLYETVRGCSEEFGPFFEAVALDSPAAQEARASYERMIKAQRESARRAAEEEELLDPPPIERVRSWLERFDGGELDAFWMAWQQLTLEPTSSRYGAELLMQPDLSVYPVWQQSDEALKARILAAGREYLGLAQPKPADWLGTPTWPLSEMCVFPVLYTLRELDGEAFAALESSVWAKWAHVCVSYSATSASGMTDERVPAQIVAKAYQEAPAEFLAALDVIKAQEASRDRGHVFVVRKLERAWDDQLEAHVLGWLSEGEPQPAAVASCLEAILERRSQAGIQWARDRLAGLATDGLQPTEQLEIVASKALQFAAAEIWPVIEELLSTHPEFSKRLFLVYEREHAH